jgi:hypothetical protein
MAQLFEYAVFLDDKRDKDGEIVDEAKVLVEPTTVLAASQEHVAMLAARAVPEEHVANIDRVKVVVRPF